MAACASALAQDAPDTDVVPVLSQAVKRGNLEITPLAPQAPSASRSVDGATGDWTGTATSYGGTLIHDRGELIYQDFLFDALGAENGNDAQRVAVLEPLEETAPQTHRLEDAFQADGGGQVGAPVPPPVKAETYYGDAGLQDKADLLELRLAADSTDLWLLARTANMTAANQTAVLVLLDTAEGDTEYAIPFGTGLKTTSAEKAILLTGNSGTVADLATGETSPLEAGRVATNPDGWVNAVEARIPRSLLGGNAVPRVAVATGHYSAAGGGSISTVANVAFRMAEPPRETWEKRQALALLAGSIDPFFRGVNLAQLEAGKTEGFTLGQGYHAKIFRSSPSSPAVAENGTNGLHQHYGLYIPENYRADGSNPLQYWLHFRGGRAHTAVLLPRLFKHFGEAHDTVVVSPDGRGGSTWYTGRGLIDINEVWDDVLETVEIDQDKVYLSGHSMGGFGSYLLSTLYPDRFAAAMPVAGPVTQGLFTGVDFPGCSTFSWDGYSFCYVEQNGGNARAQHTIRLLDNLRNVPLAVYQGAADELVWTPGVTQNVRRLVELGYRHRYYLFPTYEHFTHPLVDEWAAGARYMHTFERDENPRQVTYKRDMPFERATETSGAGTPAAGTASFSFDSAYWMSGLEPVDAVNGVASFQGTSLAIQDDPKLTHPEVGGPAEPGQAGPFAMTGLAQIDDPINEPGATSNGFDITLRGARAVTLDLNRMGIDAGQAISGRIDTQHPLELTLKSGSGTQTVQVPAGISTLSL